MLRCTLYNQCTLCLVYSVRTYRSFLHVAISHPLQLIFVAAAGAMEGVMLQVCSAVCAVQGLLGQFVDYIKERKSVALEDLAAQFGLRVQVQQLSMSVLHSKSCC